MAVSCADANSLGYMLEHALGTPAPPPPRRGHRAPPVPTADFAGAARLYERACDGGLMRGCNNLAALYLRGVGVPDGANPVRARELFMRACEGQNGLGCSNLGQLYELGTGISATSCARASSTSVHASSVRAPAAIASHCSTTPDAVWTPTPIARASSEAKAARTDTRQPARQQRPENAAALGVGPRGGFQQGDLPRACRSPRGRAVDRA